MNERIGKLAVEAGAHWEHSDWNMPSAVYFSERDLEKFAELIVAECMEVFSKDLPEPGDGKMLEVINRVCAVAEHFGVER